MWWYVVVIPAVKKLSQENYEIETSLGYIVIDVTTVSKQIDKQTNKNKTNTQSKKKEQKEPNIIYVTQS